MKHKIKQHLKKLLHKLRYFTPHLPVKKHIDTDIEYTPFNLFRWTVAAGLWGFTIFTIYILYIFHDLPDIDDLEELNRERKVTILDSNDTVLANFGDLYGHYINYFEIPRHLRNAVIATEDRKFFDHWGVDPIGITRAAYANFKAGYTVQGGSTITQQLAKIVFLSPKRTIKRKLQEALLAIQLEHRYTKQQLLAIYLNRVYLGAGIYGIDSASKYYFGKNVKDLNLYESAIIAGLLKAPSRFSPTNNIELAGQRAYQVLLNMYDAGYISQKQLEDANKNPVKIETRMLGAIKRHYFTRWVYNQLPNLIKDRKSDLIVKTTLNLKFQKIAEQALKRWLKPISESRKVEQGAIVVLDKNSRIIAMVGGREFTSSPFNRATQAKRQAGSAFKLFVYAAAMEAGYTPSSKMEDKEISFGEWTPENYHKEFLGVMNLETAFKKSINTVAVQLAQEVGVANVVKAAKKMGVRSPIEHNLSIALGTTSVSLLELTNAYATILNRGKFNKPYTIQYIRKAEDGEFLYVKPFVEPKQVLSKDAVDSLDRLLTEAVRSGTAKYVRSNFRISAKTGTSQDFRDAWFAGYSNDVAIGVWMGNDNYSPMDKITGGTYPTYVARSIFRKINPYFQ
ncbi:MAG: PBP1A family penicillin-binding protein [Rickettsiales bacterium]